MHNEQYRRYLELCKNRPDLVSMLGRFASAYHTVPQVRSAVRHHGLSEYEDEIVAAVRYLWSLYLGPYPMTKTKEVA